MKSVALFISFKFASALHINQLPADYDFDAITGDTSHQIEYHRCIPEVINGTDTGFCEPSLERNGQKSLSLIEAINCHEASGQQKSICDDGIEGKPYFWWINQALRNYACNCFSDNNFSTDSSGITRPVPGANGIPLDTVDDICHTLSRRYACLLIDFPEEIERCDYFQDYQFVQDTVSGIITCGPLSNPNYQNIPSSNEEAISWACKRQVCEADKEFAESSSGYLWNPKKFIAENSLKYNTFDNVNICNRPAAGNVRTDTCCGELESRVPFDSSQKKCCNGEIFWLYDADSSC